MDKLLQLLGDLEKAKIHYRLNKVNESILIEVAVPGERWEIECFEDGSMQVEKFRSDGKIFDEAEIDNLFKYFAD